MTEQLLTVEQAADRLHVHVITVRRQLRSGTLRGIKRGNRWRVPESALYGTAGPQAAPQTQPDQSPLARALAMVEERDARTGPVVPRVLGVNDAATEIRQMREERTP